MNRDLILKSIADIKEGKTFYRSQLPQTLENKRFWEELRQEVTTGYSIDLPKAKTNRMRYCA